MADLWLNWQSRLKITADADGELAMWNRNLELPRTQLVGYMSFSGTYDLVPADVGVTLAQGDITTIKFIYLEANFDGMGYKMGGAFYTVLGKAVTGQPAIAQLMTSATSVLISAGGTTGGRLTYLFCGV